MEQEFWRARWDEGRIGFHEGEVNRYLETWWPRIVAAADSRVLVPLCGKAVDLLWLRERGHRVVGVEFAAAAVEAFEAEHGQRDGLHLLQADFLALQPSELAAAGGGPPQAWYDRAAMVALPPEMRALYVDRLHALLPSDARGLLVTFAYPQEEKQGPPFSVEADEVRERYAAGFEIELLADVDRLGAEPRHREAGLTRLHEQVWRLRRR